MTFDPACTFLLDLGYENLFEDIGPPGSFGPFRCKGCRKEIAPNERRSHYAHHRRNRRSYAKVRRSQVQHETSILDAALDTGEPDRASADGGTDGTASSSSANGRSGSSRPLEKGDRVPSTRDRKKKTATSRPSRKRAANATAERPAADEKAEKGTAILDALYKNLELEIGKFEKKPNKSETSTRLLLDGKAFAVVFPPRPNSVAVKIPKQLMSVEKSLAKGHGFKTTGWGLTRTLDAAADAPKVAKALALAAKAAKPDDEPES